MSNTLETIPTVETQFTVIYDFDNEIVGASSDHFTAEMKRVADGGRAYVLDTDNFRLYHRGEWVTYPISERSRYTIITDDEGGDVYAYEVEALSDEDLEDADEGGIFIVDYKNGYYYALGDWHIIVPLNQKDDESGE